MLCIVFVRVSFGGFGLNPQIQVKFRSVSFRCNEFRADAIISRKFGTHSVQSLIDSIVWHMSIVKMLASILDYPNKRCAKHSFEFKRCEIANSHLISTISVRCFRLTTKHIQNRHTQFIWFTKFVGTCPIFGTPFVLFTCQKKRFVLLLEILISWINTLEKRRIETDTQMTTKERE